MINHSSLKFCASLIAVYGLVFLHGPVFAMEILNSDTVSTFDPVTKMSSEPMVVYQYVTDKVVSLDEIAVGDEFYIEDSSKRSDDSRTYTDGNGKFVTRFFSGQIQKKVGDSWYQVETNKVSPFEFDSILQTIEAAPGGSAVPSGGLLNLLNPFVFTAHAQTTYYPSYDGYCRKTDSTWAGAHDAASADACDASEEQPNMMADGTNGSSPYIQRMMWSFDTSGIPDDATIQSATFNVFTNTTNSGDQETALVRVTPATANTLVVEDFDQWGVTEGATRVTMTSNQYNTWTLNATGIGWISKTGYTMFGLRFKNDIEDFNPSTRVYRGVYMSEYTGTDHDPYLEVTWSEGGGGEGGGTTYWPTSSPTTTATTFGYLKFMASTSTAAGVSILLLGIPVVVLAWVRREMI